MEEYPLHFALAIGGDLILFGDGHLKSDVQNVI